MWLWSFNPNKQYAAKYGYTRLLEAQNPGLIPCVDRASDVWIKWVPFIMWKFSQNRIPLLPNLLKHDILHSEAQVFCKMCDTEKEESWSHLFFECRFVG